VSRAAAHSGRRPSGTDIESVKAIPMVNYISGLVFVVLLLLGIVLAAAIGQTSPVTAVIFSLAWLFLDVVVSSSIRLAAQWQKAVVFRLGKFHSIKGPGLFMIIPLIDQLRMVDTRVLAVNIPKQQVITRDNVPVTIDGVLFFRVDNPAEAIIMVQDYRYMIAQYSQTSLRDVIGQMSLDQLLTEREEIARAIEQHVEKDTKGWGLEVTGLRIQDIDMPEELKKMMSRQASAEREKRATITKAEGDKEAAVNLSLAAKTMAASPGAMQLRTLQTIDGLGPTASNTVVLAVPIEILESLALLKEAYRNNAAAERSAAPSA
jgi:regulator of protease activity HflC (stomatin/prohibitin superfamily)